MELLEINDNLSTFGSKYYAIFETAAGWIGLSGSANGISHSTFPQGSQKLATLLLGEAAGQSTCNSDFFKEVIAQIRDYFQGHEVNFSEKLDLSQTTSFERAVLEATRLIPFGKTRSYGWIARQIGSPKAARAVGSALRKNPLPILIPCHRVLAADGKLCGFSGGLEMKRYLLKLEAGAFIS